MLFLRAIHKDSVVSNEPYIIFGHYSVINHDFFFPVMMVVSQMFPFIHDSVNYQPLQTFSIAPGLAFQSFINNHLWQYIILDHYKIVFHWNQEDWWLLLMSFTTKITNTFFDDLDMWPQLRKIVKILPLLYNVWNLFNKLLKTINYLVRKNMMKTVFLTFECHTACLLMFSLSCTSECYQHERWIDKTQSTDSSVVDTLPLWHNNLWILYVFTKCI